MTKYLTKPILAIHFIFLAFLMTLTSPVAAQELSSNDLEDVDTEPTEYEPVMLSWDEVEDVDTEPTESEPVTLSWDDLEAVDTTDFRDACTFDDEEDEGFWGTMQSLFAKPKFTEDTNNEPVTLTWDDPADQFAFQKGMTAYEARDYATALKEWRPLAEQGNALAQFELGWMYRKGEGVRQDYKEAVKWYRLAAKKGHADAHIKLGRMYSEGKGVLQDYKKAAKCWRLAAKQGHANAPFLLGRIHEEGEGILQDNTMAHMWYNIASANGDEYGASLRGYISERMTPAAIEKAQAMARECMNSGYTKCGY